MMNFFRKDVKYTDVELFRALQKDGVVVTEQEVQKAKENDPKTLYKIAEAYYKSDSPKSFAWFHKAALEDHAEAQYRVGHMYIWGTGVSKDYKLAMDWAIKSASTGNSSAQFIVAQLYYYGWGVSEDYQQAMDWFMKAANNGNKDAMKIIGNMYKQGQGVTENIPIAVEWYKKAAHQGKEWMQDKLGDKNEENDHAVGLNSEKTNIIGNVDQKVEDQLKHSNSDVESRINLIEKQHKMHIEALQKESDLRQQEQIQKNEENRQLKEEVAKLKELLQDNSINDIYYDSGEDENERDRSDSTVKVEQKSGNDNRPKAVGSAAHSAGIKYDSDENYADPNYDSDDNCANPNYNVDDNFADPNYDSSDNEDLTKDLYLD